MSHHDHAHPGEPESRDMSRLPLLFPGSLVLGLVALGLAAVFGWSDKHRLAMAYLTGYAAFLTVSVGALFFVIIQHLTRAGWSVSIRRVAEVMAANFVTLLVLAIPILVKPGAIYHHWIAPHGEGAYLIHEKSAWLNQPFWTARVLFYLLAWSGLAGWFWCNSLKQDKTGDVAITLKLQNYSGLAMVIFGLTVNFGFMDLLMTLDPHWYSTMFGVYCFAGSFLTFNAVIILLFRLFLHPRGVLTQSVTTEHFHDLGKFMFAFVFFWGYVGYSQWMLIWYGNIPEETQWFAKRGMTTSSLWEAGRWGRFALLLVLGHLFIPFAGLLSRWSKRILGLLTFWVVWIIFMHFIDMFWLVMPEYAPGEVNDPTLGQSLLLAGLCWLGVGGIWLAGFAFLARRGSLIPLNDPRFHEAVSYEVY